MRKVVVRKANVETHYTQYTREEIVAFWNTEGQGHKQALNRSSMCVVAPATKEAAIDISALFIRDIFASPTCTHYDGKTISLYCGNVGAYDYPEVCRKVKSLIRRYQKGLRKNLHNLYPPEYIVVMKCKNPKFNIWIPANETTYLSKKAALTVRDTLQKELGPWQFAIAKIDP
jgi:hypothetical protein